MAITVDSRNAGGTCNTGSGGATITWTHAVGALTNGILIVCVESYDANGVTTHPSSIAWDAAGANLALTPIAQASQGFLSNALFFIADIWYLLAPPNASKLITVTYSAGAIAGGAGSVSYGGVAQSSTFNAASPQRANGTGNSISLTVTSATGEMVVDSVASYPGLLTVGGSQTQISNHFNTINQASSDQAGAASVAMAWTGSSSPEWLSAGVSIKPAGGGGASPTDINFHGGGRGSHLGMRRGLSYHDHPQISLAAYYRERERAQREFMAKVQRRAA